MSEQEIPLTPAGNEIEDKPALDNEIKKKKLSKIMLEQIANLPEKAEVLASAKIMTMIINSYCMDQKTPEYMEISKAYNDLFVKLNTELSK